MQTPFKSCASVPQRLKVLYNLSFKFFIDLGADMEV
ncbi:hypothetical protein L916_12750 [Phytophthora nicotianae]|uniref:Uncharacterized protein n=1 Tax=Phytophthora nicotianae TaxID=4792 RepID=W2INI7_PHYNI|nr:hypothetical protein L916_12750 [Phytophthora nicotianae]